jgi:hypothetical protein
LHFASAFPTLKTHVAVEESPTMNHPNPRDPRRNLLFGLLAFHNNFMGGFAYPPAKAYSSDQTAMSGWTGIWSNSWTNAGKSMVYGALRNS